MSKLLLSPTLSEDSLALEQAARDAGWPVERLASWRVPESLVGRDDLVLYGEALFVRAIAEQVDYALLEAQPGWLAGLPSQYLQRRVRLMKLGEAEAISGPSFIKPAGDKAFASRVYESGDAFLATVMELSRNINVLVSEPVEWRMEYRCFVLDRRVETQAVYAKGGELTKSAGMWPHSGPMDAKAIAFAVSVVTDPKVAVPPAFVMDIGLIEGRGWAVIEANPAWGSGIYGCDPAKVLPVVVRACVHSSRLSQSDRLWIPAWESWFENDE